MASTAEWTVLEKLLLAQAVYKFGEDNWVHIARNLRQHNMLNRPPEFFNQKNCSLQYYLLIEELETEKRHTKATAAAAAAHQEMPPVVKLARQLYMQRIDELKHAIDLDNQRFLELVTEIDAIRSGRRDKQLLAEMEKQGIPTTASCPSALQQPITKSDAIKSTPSTQAEDDKDVKEKEASDHTSAAAEEEAQAASDDTQKDESTETTQTAVPVATEDAASSTSAENPLPSPVDQKRVAETDVESHQDVKRLRMEAPSDLADSVSRNSSSNSFATAFTHHSSIENRPPTTSDTIGSVPSFLQRPLEDTQHDSAVIDRKPDNGTPSSSTSNAR